MFGGKPGRSSLPNNLSCVDITSIITNSDWVSNSYFHWLLRVSQNITISSKNFFIKIYIRVWISNSQFANRESKVKFREPLLTRFLFSHEL